MTTEERAKLADRIERIASTSVAAIEGDNDPQYVLEQTIADLDALVLDLRAAP